jgi:hypothetical protein
MSAGALGAEDDAPVEISSPSSTAIQRASPYDWSVRGLTPGMVSVVSPEEIKELSNRKTHIVSALGFPTFPYTPEMVTWRKTLHKSVQASTIFPHFYPLNIF